MLYQSSIIKNFVILSLITSCILFAGSCQAINSGEKVDISDETNNKASEIVSTATEITQTNQQHRSSTALPNIFIMSPSGFHMFQEIISMVHNVTFNKTQRSHTLENYNQVFIEGIYNKKPGDVVVLLFSLDTKDRIPPTYEDLLPKPWSEIEAYLKEGETQELTYNARDLKMILLAAPTKAQLELLIRKSKSLNALTESQEVHSQKRYIIGEFGQVGPVKYTVTIPKDIRSVAKVSCSISSHQPLLLYMNDSGAPREGHAFFLRNLEATDANSNQVPVEYIGGNKFKLNVDFPINLKYEVLLLHDKFDLPYGRDEAPNITKDGVFWTGRALFAIADMKNITVCFNIPNGWRVSTAWKSVPNKPFTYLLEDEKELTEAFIFAGTHIEEKTKVDNMEITLALGNEMRHSKDILLRSVQRLLNEYVKLFGGSPKARTLIVANLYDRKSGFDGGVFGNSISLLFGNNPSEKDMHSWAPFIAHELFHLWNAQSIMHTGDEQWFSEGFTDYYAMVICARMGMINEDEFIHRLGRACRHYFSESERIPIRKGQEYALQYAGGLLVAISLDIQIRKLTNNTKSLDDLMRQMYQEFGKTGNNYTIKDVIRVINSITGKNHTNFFEKYVQGIDELPLNEYFNYMGLYIEKEVEEGLPNRNYVIHEVLRIKSLRANAEGLLVRRSQEAGYQDEDYLIAIGRMPVKTFRDIQVVAKKLNPGDKVELTLLRNDRKTTMSLILGGKLPLPKEREVKVSIHKQDKLDHNQKMILSGILMPSNID